MNGNNYWLIGYLWFASNNTYYSKVVMSERSPNYVQHCSLEFLKEGGL